MRKLSDKLFPDGGTAVNAGRVFEKCVNIANHVCGSKIILEKPDDTVLVHAELNGLTAQIIMLLENIVMGSGKAVLKMIVDKENETVCVHIDCDGVFNKAYFEFMLYTDVPSFVVSDAVSDHELERIIAECFAQNKFFGKFMKGYEDNRE